MSEQPPEITQRPEEISGHDPSLGLTYKEYLEQGGEIGQTLRAASEPNRSEQVGDVGQSSTEAQVQDSVSAITERELVDRIAQGAKPGENVTDLTEKGLLARVKNDGAGSTQPESDSGSSNGALDTTTDSVSLRPTKEEDVAKMINDPEFDPDNEDGMGSAGVASVAMEPWTFDDEKTTSGEAGNPENSTIPNTSGNSENPEDSTQTPTPEDSKDPKNPMDPRLQEGYKRIGDAVTERAKELEEQGFIPSDASNQAQEEFWGANPYIPPENPPQGPPEGPPQGPPEGPPRPEIPGIPKTPELEAAEAELAIARDEYARMKAGRESSTFFSVKFSSKKVEAAKQAYEKAVEVASIEAAKVLTDSDLPREQIISAINFGTAVEAVKLINTQYDKEKQAVESKRFKKFYDWWSKQSGVKGSIKKGAVMALIAAPIGVGIGIVGAPVFAGGGVGALIGLAGAKSVSKGLVGNVIKKNAEAESTAQEKAEDRERDIVSLITDIESRGRVVQQAYIDKLLAKQTTETKHGNDKRAAKAMAIGALFAAGGALVGNMIGDHLWGGPHTPPDLPGGGDHYIGNPNYDRMMGMNSLEPNGPERTASLFRYAWDHRTSPEVAGPHPDLNAIDQFWDGIRGQVTNRQGMLFNRSVGKIAGTPGLGNGWTATHGRELLEFVKDAKAGTTPEDIVKLIQSNS